MGGTIGSQPLNMSSHTDTNTNSDVASGTPDAHSNGTGSTKRKRTRRKRKSRIDPALVSVPLPFQRPTNLNMDSYDPSLNGSAEN